MQLIRSLKYISIEQYAWLPFLLLFLSLHVVGCGLFSTRDPETPSGTQSANEIATSPLEVLERLNTAIVLRDPEIYMSVIALSFTYTATQEAYKDNPDFFTDWNYNNESSFVHRLLSPDLLPLSVDASLDFEHINDIEGIDSVLYIEKYVLVVEINQEGFPSLYDGQSELNMSRQDDGGWRITSWLDQAGGEAETMSKLRATL